MCGGISFLNCLNTLCNCDGHKHGERRRNSVNVIEERDSNNFGKVLTSAHLSGFLFCIYNLSRNIDIYNTPPEAQAVQIPAKHTILTLNSQDPELLICVVLCKQGIRNTSS